jgi:hypothetical protein
MNVSRRRVLKGVAAAGVLPLFNIGCAGFGQGRAVRIAKGDKLRVALIGCGHRAAPLSMPCFLKARGDCRFPILRSWSAMARRSPH